MGIRKSKRARRPQRRSLPAHSSVKKRESPRNLHRQSLKASANSRNLKKSSTTLLTRSATVRPGPKPSVKPTELLNRSCDLEGTLRGCWNSKCWEKDCLGRIVKRGSRQRERLHTGCWDWIDWTILRRAQTEAEARAAFARVPEYYQRKLLPYWELLVRVLNEPTFPKESRKSQIRYLADSLAASGLVSARRSRDLCLKARKIEPHHVLRKEFYIECSCGYEGPALDGGCPHSQRPNTWTEQEAFTAE